MKIKIKKEETGKEKGGKHTAKNNKGEWEKKKVKRNRQRNKKEDITRGR